MATRGDANPPRDIWTGLVVDPFARPIARTLARLPWVTPNRVTAFAGMVAVLSAAAFAMGLYRVGGVLFLIRFLFDVVDGMVARLQQSSSVTGASLDLTVDVLGITLVLGCLSVRAVHDGIAPVALAVALMAVVASFNWLLMMRKQLALRAGLEHQGGSGGRLAAGWGPLRRWDTWARSRNIATAPYSVEAETLVFGLLPATLGVLGVLPGFIVGLCFYSLAAALNIRRIRRISRLIDERI